MAENAATTEPHEDDHFEELVVLDSAGRLQLPKPYREALGIRHRVRLEMTHDGLLIRPLAEAELHPTTTLSSTISTHTTPERGRLSRWLNRFKRQPNSQELRGK